MANDAMSPFGISWGYLALLMLPALLVASLALAVVRRRDVAAPGLWLLIAAAIAAGLWTVFTVGGPVMADNPRGLECLMNPIGENPDLSVNWDGDCGRALERHLVVSGGPSLLMLGVMAGATVQGLRSNRRSPAA